ncbi:MAG TPA: GspMb/PilO family protein [Pyrinomonadaceae bacterium]|nr:GspMb/PilO family protein [Pyrinomonadaceae bacterium]
MSRETSNAQQDAAARAFRARLAQFRSGRRRSVLGLPEIAALAAAAALLLAAVSAYLLLLRPQRARLASLALERETLQRQLQSTQGTLAENRDTQSSVREILSSLEDFEITHLGVSGSGNTGVIDELHRLLAKNKLRISGGMSYTRLEEAVPGATPQRQAAPGGGEQGAQQRVVQSVFPGVGVTLTVEGPYTALRRFIRDVESSRHFIVVNSVELEGITESGSSFATAAPTDLADPAAAAAAPAAPATATGRLVSLRLDMSAYFRRASAGAGAQQ